MVLFLDTETTGKVNKDWELEDPRQPRLVSVAALAFEGMQFVQSVTAIIRPDGFVIPEEATRIHGISHEQAMAIGVPPASVMALVNALIHQSTKTIIYNAKFDTKIWKIERINAGVTENPFDYIEAVCAMLPAANAMKIPSGYGDYKWPKLSEAYEFFMGIPMPKTHVAFWDTWHLATLSFRMREYGYIQF